MAYITDYVYYENGGTPPTNLNQGSYQYVTLPDIINNYMLIYVGEDKIVDNVKKHVVRFHAKQAIKDLNYNASRSVKVLETTIGSDLKLVMPHDYVDYVRMSLEQNGVLRPLTESSSVFSANAYVLDGNGDLTFDGNGAVIYGTSELDTERLAATPAEVDSDVCTRYTVGAQYGLETSEAQGNPRFWVNRDSGVIDFDSDMLDKLIVLEYISDGMMSGIDADIVVDKFFEAYMYAYISHMILKTKRNIPGDRREEARREKVKEYRNARIMMSDIDPLRLLMKLRGQDKWIK